MTSADNPAECLERADMHDRLAAATDDADARIMHHAMAAEFRRRADLLRTTNLTPRSTGGPVLEMYSGYR